MIYVAVLGYGVVGSGVVEVIKKNRLIEPIKTSSDTITTNVLCRSAHFNVFS